MICAPPLPPFLHPKQQPVITNCKFVKPEYKHMNSKCPPLHHHKKYLYATTHFSRGFKGQLVTNNIRFHKKNL